MLSVAICGAGGLGRNHAENFSQIADAEVSLVFDIVPEAAEALAQDVGARATTNEDDLWADDVDAVVITTPTPFHADYVIKAAQAGKHIFCEKPMCRHMEQGEAMLEAVDEAGVTFMVGHVLRFFPEYVRARELVQSGAIGTVGVVRTSRINTLPGGPNSWFCNYEMSGGVTLDMTIHDFDWLLWTFGPARRVYSVGVPDRMPPIDYGLTTIRFECGVIAHCEGSWADLGQFRTSFDIAGSGGLLRHDSTQMPTLRTQLRSGQEGLAAVQVPESPAVKSPYLLEDEHFVHCVLTGEKPAISGEEALAAVEVALAALASTEAGGKVIEL